MEFLWRFAHSDDKDQGWDETVAWANDKERGIFESAVHAYARGDQGTVSEELVYASLDHKFPVCKVRVTNDEVHNVTQDSGSYANRHSIGREFIVGAPFHTTCSTPGRGTRTFLAYDLQDKSIKFLKDTWVPSLATSPEMDAYRLLHEKDIPYVMHPVCGGFVRDDEGAPQSTTNHKWASVAEGWLAPLNPTMRGYRHVRLVQDIMHCLKDLKSSRELIKVLRDVVRCKSPTPS